VDADIVYRNVERFMRLHRGLPSAFGTGAGRWVKRPPTKMDFTEHLLGRGPGIGIAPLRPDGTVLFASIDLDEPDFTLAREFQKWIPGASWIERSRSGNAHVHVYFSEPCLAWVATGILKYAIESSGAERVEVFPKQTSYDHVRLGNYINLSYHGSDRPIIIYNEGRYASPLRWHAMELPLERFLDEAEAKLTDPRDWVKRAAWLMIEDPALKRSGDRSEFGTGSPHMCADYVIEGALSGERPVTVGNRSVVYFNLAKQLANSEMWTEPEVLDALKAVRDASDGLLGQDPKPDAELARYVRNAYEKRYTSTGCDDPVFAPFARPDCPIAHPDRRTR
jgi:hypothetical protein